MTVTRPLRGTCLCGDVAFVVDGPVRDVFECHCHRCRITTGNFMAATAARRSAITFLADTSLRWYSPDDDPEVGYGFCRRCGSSLFWRHENGDDDPSISICAGSLATPTGLRTTEAWFTAEAADHVRLRTDITHYPSEP